jgi:RNA polymerase sigma-70 factor (ECF subfamily)
MTDLHDQRHDQFLRLFAAHEPAIRAFVRSLLPSRADAA